VLGQDVIYVGGGSTANLLAVWRTHGLDRILRRAWEVGVVLCGISAGMNCCFAQSLTDSLSAHQLSPLHDGLGLLPGSACPHYDGETRRRPIFQQLVGAHRVEPRENGWVDERPLATRYLGPWRSAEAEPRGTRGQASKARPPELNAGRPRPLRRG